MRHFGLLGVWTGVSHGSGRARCHRVVMSLTGDGDHPLRAQCIAKMRRLPADLHLRPMHIEGLAGAVVALAAAGGHGQFELQLVEAGAAASGRMGDVAIRDPVADTNYHASTVMRIVRISKRALQRFASIVAGGRPGRSQAVAGSGTQLRLQVVLLADLAHQLQLRFQEVDVFLGVFEDVLKEVARDVVTRLLAAGNGVFHGRL